MAVPHDGQPALWCAATTTIGHVCQSIFMQAACQDALAGKGQTGGGKGGHMRHTECSEHTAG
jgi:hypothetical protein